MDEGNDALPMMDHLNRDHRRPREQGRRQEGPNEVTTKVELREKHFTLKCLWERL